MFLQPLTLQKRYYLISVVGKNESFFKMQGFSPNFFKKVNRYLNVNSLKTAEQCQKFINAAVCTNFNLRNTNLLNVGMRDCLAACLWFVSSLFLKKSCTDVVIETDRAFSPKFNNLVGKKYMHR